jgi:hypothetical protein
MKKAAMLEAHVRYELQQWEGKPFRLWLQEEITALFEWLAEVRLDEVMAPAQLVGWTQRTVVTLPLYGELVEKIEQNVLAAYAFLQQDETRGDALLPRKILDQAVKQLIGLEALRDEVIHQSMHSSVYARLVANVLYQGIKGFVLTENVLAKKIPGASSLVRFGQNALNAAAPQLEQNIDRQLTAFIQTHIQETIQESEDFLRRTLDEPMIQALGDELWEANATRTLAAWTGYADPAFLSALVGLVKEFWLHYRATPQFLALVEEVVQRFWQRHGAATLRSLLDEMGITPDLAAQEAYTFAVPFLEKARADGFLEQRIRRRLAAFYVSYQA